MSEAEIFARHFPLHDWHTALVPVYLKTLYSWDQVFSGTRTVLTIHNIGYQGVFGSGILHDMGLSDSAGLLDQEDLDEGPDQFSKVRSDAC